LVEEFQAYRIFEAERPRPPHHVRQELLMAVEKSGEYF